MTTRDMLRDVLITLYLGAQVAYKLALEFPESQMFYGYLTCIKDRLYIPYRGVHNEHPEQYLYDDYILWKYSEELWGKYSEVLNCEKD